MIDVVRIEEENGHNSEDRVVHGLLWMAPFKVWLVHHSRRKRSINGYVDRGWETKICMGLKERRRRERERERERENLHGKIKQTARARERERENLHGEIKQTSRARERERERECAR